MPAIDKRVLILREVYDSFLTLTNAHTVGNNVDIVCPNLYVGTRDFANDGNNLKTCGITHALNVCDDLKRTDRDMFDDLNIVFAHVSFGDVENPQHRKSDCLSLFRMTSSFVREALASGGKLLVYSILGVNQAPAVVIAYLIETFCLSVERASLVLAFKRLIKPSDPILVHLIRLNDLILRKKSRNVDEGHTVERSKRLRDVLNLVNGVDANPLVCPPLEARMILFNLFVGTDKSASDLQNIHQNHITHVLNLCGENTNRRQKYRDMGIGLTTIETTRDFSFDVESLVEMCVALISDCLKRGERLLIYGRERESLVFTVMTAYVMKSHSVSLEKALAAITERRCVYLGVNYLLFLFRYEQKMHQRLQAGVDQTFYFPHCDFKLKSPHELLTIRFSMETSV